jgi:hypothetical protein
LLNASNEKIDFGSIMMNRRGIKKKSSQVIVPCRVSGTVITLHAISPGISWGRETLPFGKEAHSP